MTCHCEPTTLASKIKSLHGKRAIAVRWGQPEAFETAGRELHEALLEKQIRSLSGTWPPLTDEQRARLVVLLDTCDHPEAMAGAPA
jgi:hypothetical protein